MFRLLALVVITTLAAACGSSGNVDPASLEEPEAQPATASDDSASQPDEGDVFQDDVETVELETPPPAGDEPEPAESPEPEPPPLFAPIELALLTRDGDRIGRAIVTADGDPQTGRTVVALLLDDGTAVRAAGVLRGACGGRGEPAFELSQIFSGISTTTLAVPLRELQDGGYKIVVRRGERADGAVAGCVEVPAEDEA